MGLLRPSRPGVTSDLAFDRRILKIGVIGAVVGSALFSLVIHVLLAIFDPAELPGGSLPLSVSLPRSLILWAMAPNIYAVPVMLVMASVIDTLFARRRPIASRGWLAVALGIGLVFPVLAVGTAGVQGFLSADVAGLIAALSGYPLTGSVVWWWTLPAPTLSSGRI